MLNLSHLAPPPPEDQVTTCETDGCLRSMPPAAAYTTAKQWLGDQNVDIAMAPDVIRPAHSKHEARDAFCAHTETPWQKVVAVYYEEGLESAIREYVQNQEEQEQGGKSFRVSTARFALKVLTLFNKFHQYIPLQLISRPNNDFSHALQESLKWRSNGGSNIVVSMAWHPHTCTVAVLSADDTIRVFGTDRTLSPQLKHRAQKNVTSMAWMPYSASILAIGCDGGILIWTLDPTSVVTRPSGSCLSQLAHPDTTPTSSISWHPKGTKLACVGGGGHSIVVWDIGLELSTVCHTSLTGTIDEVLWSPDGSRLLAATTGLAIKVFETKNWTYERWTLESRLQSAVWSQSGNMLLFAIQEEPAIFCLKFAQGEGVGGAQVATQVADLTPTVTTTEDGEEVSIGGAVHQLSWDPRSERLAVVFRNSEFIALLHTRSFPQLHIAPGGFIRGEPCNIPISAHYQKSVGNGAILSIIWNNNPVQHIPLRYTSMDPLNTTCYDTAQFNNTTLNYSIDHAATLLSPRLNFSIGPTSPLSYPISGLFTSP